MTRYQVTVRHGRRVQRYHTLVVEGSDAVDALRAAADAVPPEVAAEADLVELREAPDPEGRAFLDEGGGGSAP